MLKPSFTLALLASCFLLGACAGSQPRGLRAESAVDRYKKARPVYAHVEAGFGLPEGLIGGGFGIAPASFFNAELGVGASDSGPQLALMLGAHFAASRTTRLGLSSGLSVGPYTASERPFADVEGISYDKRWDYQLWSNSEVTIRWPIGANTAVRYHVGLAVPVSSASNPRCTILWEGDEECAARQPHLTPYIGLALEHHL